MFITLLATLALVQAPVPTPSAAADTTVYRTLFLRAAPGDLLELVELYRDRMPLYRAAGEPEPILARHSQGDHWDLLLIEPVGSLTAYHSPERLARWRRAEATLGYDAAAYEAARDRLEAWREELFVAGPDVAEFSARQQDAGFYHLEVFLALAGERDALLRQRQMENDYLGRVGRPDNLIFTRVGGAAWDLFTLGFYRNLQDFATPANVSDAEDDAAARAAGFEGSHTIGSYLRTFLQRHHDTLLNRVR